MKTFSIRKISDECTTEQKYEVLINGSFYTSNISKQLAKQYAIDLLAKGFVLSTPE